jgi:hypothetical protein
MAAQHQRRAADNHNEQLQRGAIVAGIGAQFYSAAFGEGQPNANTYAERFVRSIKEECLHRIIPIGGRHFRRAVAEYVAHYHLERNHQGLENVLIEDTRRRRRCGSVRRRRRLGGLLNYYERAA